jgi:hypothetical protein
MEKQIEKHKGGRPTILTSEVVAKLERCLAAGFSVSVATAVSGVSRSAYYERIALDKEFKDKMRFAEEWSSYKARLTILKAIDNGDVAAARFWLERKCRVEFAPPKPY